MGRSVTVTFQDGSTHTYDNVPDSVQDNEVKVRAESQFGDKTITDVRPGAYKGHVEPEHVTTGNQRVIGGVQTAFQTAGEVTKELLSNPLVDIGLAYAGRGPLLRTIERAGEAWRGGPPPAGPVAPPQSVIQPAPGYSSTRAPAPTPGTPAQTLEALKQPELRPTGPVAPEAAPAPKPTPQQPSVLQRGMDYARQMQQIAAEKVAGAARAAAPMARAGVGLAMAGTPSNIGQRYPFPTTGPMAGREINPQTGRPWTPEELAAYNAQ